MKNESVFRMKEKMRKRKQDLNDRGKDENSSSLRLGFITVANKMGWQKTSPDHYYV